MLLESLSGKCLLLFHCSLLACISPLLYYILPSVWYHLLGRLCWQSARFGFAFILQCHVFFHDKSCKSMGRLLEVGPEEGFSRCPLPHDEAAIFKMQWCAALLLCLEPLQHSCPWFTEAHPLPENVSIQDQISQVSVQILPLLLHWAQPYWEAV